MPVKVIAATLGLIGFAVAIAAGVAAGNSALTTLSRAIGAMFVCWLVGWLVGSIGRRAVLEHVDDYKQTHPIPRVEDVYREVNEQRAASEDAAEASPQDATQARAMEESGAA